MEEYLDCKCGGKHTYRSVAGDICCSACFSALKKKDHIIRDMKARICSDDDGWSVKVGDVEKKHFSKYEDYALTEAKDYVKKLNEQF